MPLAWALQGPPGAPRLPLPPSGSWRENRQELDGGRGSRNPLGGFLGAAGNRRETTGFPLLTAAKPPRSECPAGHRRPVGGATASRAPGGGNPPGS
ncbi:hypothetical protein NDU88_001540 [Pleurodeles waltl]|uniref:Uncharacterized protein n=1 Tax=Pleurodeles waltl TaxID=8319 RepID=A0AAV7MMZ5_PLEWA|nr:hypothetical protein NDU88_001540 [Pleurodeles waltl]